MELLLLIYSDIFLLITNLTSSGMALMSGLCHTYAMPNPFVQNTKITLHTESPDYLLCLSSLCWEGYLGGGDCTKICLNKKILHSLRKEFSFGTSRQTIFGTSEMDLASKSNTTCTTFVYPVCLIFVTGSMQYTMMSKNCLLSCE